MIEFLDEYEGLEDVLSDERSCWMKRMKATYILDWSVCANYSTPLFIAFSPLSSLFPPNSPIEKKKISNDQTRPMKVDQGFYLLAKHLYYKSESNVPYWIAKEHP